MYPNKAIILLLVVVFSSCLLCCCNGTNRNISTILNLTADVFNGVFLSNKGLYRSVERRLATLQRHAESLILVNLHIPKAGGTALAFALASTCLCNRGLLQPKQTHICKSCREIVSEIGGIATKMRSVHSRLTGWPCSVAHAPLALQRTFPGCGVEGRINDTISSRGFLPLHVILFREPFHRFCSEVSHFGGFRFSTLDWSVAIPIGPETGFTTSADFKYYPGVFPFAQVYNATVHEVAALPAELIIHNRYTKMIGGELQEFNMNFSRLTELGSRWRFLGTTEDISYSLQLSRSVSILSKSPDVLPLLFERFSDSLCVLEAIMGNVQQFTWHSQTHSHGLSRGAAKFSSEEMSQANERLKAVKSKDVAGNGNRDGGGGGGGRGDLYDVWASKNAADIVLYREVERLFDLQLQAALKLIQARVLTAALRREDALLQVPHCRHYLETTLPR